MMSLYDLGSEILKIRNSANSVEVRGFSNINLMASIFSSCDKILSEIQEIVEDKESVEQNNATEATDKEVGDSDG